jgi:Na+/proline symporter
VLELPAAEGFGFVLAAALLGGVSAAASMAIVDSTALATMVSNDLVFPTLMRGPATTESGAIGRRMLTIRRLSILAILTMGLVWALLVSAQDSLASIGLIAFAAMAQFTPHLILAATGKGRDSLAARASLSVGLALWLYTLALPPVVPTAWLDALAGTAIDPLRLLGIGRAALARRHLERRRQSDRLCRDCRAQGADAAVAALRPRAATDHQPRRSCAAHRKLRR